uniref:Putative transport and golgi organization 10 n=2 Tax=Ornithodoros turicata TaxID=34597 RepID=A0A2R5L5M6_9ACAR
MEDHSLCNSEHEQQIDNFSTVLEKIAGLYAERLLSDITLEVGGKQYAAHRLILCASSDVFQVMLMNPRWSSSQETLIQLKEEPPCEGVFEDFLRYLYTGRLRVDHLRVLPLVTLADKYNVRDLVRLCVAYMSRHIVSATRHNQLVSWLQYTLNCGHAAVHTVCSDFITWNFELVASMEDFGSLEVDVLISFLRRSDLVVRNELQLFHCIATWLLTQEQKLSQSGDQRDAFGALVIEVMSHVRFPMLCPRQLAGLLTHPLIARFKDFFMARMAAAMEFHSKTAPEKFSSCNPEFTTPRIYMAETWSTSLSIENYTKLSTYGVRTLVFTTPGSFSEARQGRTLEWTVDVYPKGVLFRRFFLIAWQGTLEIPESASKTVRLSLTSKDVHESAHVAVGVLVSGKQDDVEHVRAVVRREYTFTEEDRMLNINDLVPYSELNDAPGGSSPFLVGPQADVLKLHVVITPLDCEC